MAPRRRTHVAGGLGPRKGRCVILSEAKDLTRSIRDPHARSFDGLRMRGSLRMTAAQGVGSEVGGSSVGVSGSGVGVSLAAAVAVSLGIGDAVDVSLAAGVALGAACLCRRALPSPSRCPSAAASANRTPVTTLQSRHGATIVSLKVDCATFSGPSPQEDPARTD